MGLWTALTRPGLLARLSRGRPRRAALILVAVFLAPALVCAAIWFIGLASIFDDARWIPITVVIAFAVGAYLCLMLKFGFWGVGINSGQDGGDQFEEFSPGVAFGLGWLRWFVQVVGVGASTIVIVAVLANMRWFHLFSSPAIDSLPDRVASMPIPEDWRVTDTETGDDGDNFHPNGWYEQSFQVPEGYTFEDLQAWLADPAWQAGYADEWSGALQALRCTESDKCLAQMVPPESRQPEYSLIAWFDEASYEGDHPEVRVRLTYEEYHAPDYDISQETLDRVAVLPIPDDWVRYDAWDSTTNSGEDFVQSFVVPASFTRDDLEDWLAGPSWTAADDGAAFGDIRLTGPCRGLTDEDTYLCSAIVVATERDGPDDTDDPVESFRASLDGDHTVRISFSRNG